MLLGGCQQTAELKQPTKSPVDNNQAKPTATIFDNVRVFDGTASALSLTRNVLVVNNTIKTISASPLEPPSGYTTIHIAGGGRTLMPGLIDAHTHLYINAEPKVLLNPKTPSEKLEQIARKHSKATLMSGFTTVRDMAGPVFKLKQDIDRGQVEGPRIYPSGTIISQTSGHGDFGDPADLPHSLGGPLPIATKLGLSTIADGPDQMLAAVRYNLRQGASQIKIAAGGGVASTFDPIEVTEYTTPELRAAVDAAADFGTYVSAHAYSPTSVRRCVAACVKAIEHGQSMDQATVQLLRDKGTWLSLQVFEELPGSFSRLQRDKNHQVIVNQSRVWTWALQYGVKLAWGTDFMFGSPLYGPAQNAALVQTKTWMTPARALKMATHDNAKILALSGIRNPYPGQLGVVKQGAYADLLLVDGDPTKNLDIIANPDKNFRIIMKDGKIYKNTLAKS
ncbi:MAG: amidohydrolase family protein [Cyanobacteria bacterium K_DeepCast_35m_m2_023]|nr:amidohydrolase family protein [Cyanobacteria bacterium K_DeepCast_35m_m2_023]